MRIIEEYKKNIPEDKWDVNDANEYLFARESEWVTYK